MNVENIKGEEITDYFEDTYCNTFYVLCILYQIIPSDKKGHQQYK